MVKSRSHVANIAEVTCFHGPIGSPFLLGQQKHVVPGAQSSPDHVKRRGLYYCTTVFSFPVLSSPAARRRRGRAGAARTREEFRTRRDTAGARPGQGQDTPTRPGHGQDTARTRPGRQETARTRPGRSRQDPQGVQDAQGNGRDTASTRPGHAHPARTWPGHGKDPARTPRDGQDTAEAPAPRVVEARSPPDANEDPAPSARSEFRSTAEKSIAR